MSSAVEDRRELSGPILLDGKPAFVMATQEMEGRRWAHVRIERNGKPLWVPADSPRIEERED